MLHINLATRPFYNERAVHALMGVVGLAAGVVVVLGILQLTSLAREQSMLTMAAERDEASSQEMTNETVALQRQIGVPEVERLLTATDEANRLIGRRVFSWTAFFNQIEVTLPSGVMLTSVRPEIEDGVVMVAIGVIGRGVADIDAFIAALEGTSSFVEVLAREEEATDEGTYRTLLVGRYVGPVESVFDSVPAGGAQ